MASTLSGTSASSSSSIGSVPVSTRWHLFGQVLADALDVRKHRSGSATMWAADSGRSWIVRAALRRPDPERVGPLELQEIYQLDLKSIYFFRKFLQRKKKQFLD